MPFGDMERLDGKYDDICTRIRIETNAQFGAVVIILEGDKGTGASMQVRQSVIDQVPKFLRRMADELERDNAEREANSKKTGTKHS